MHKSMFRLIVWPPATHQFGNCPSIGLQIKPLSHHLFHTHTKHYPQIHKDGPALPPTQPPDTLQSLSGEK